ncbi:MAG: hypothetical protein ACRBN8_45680 [Nannocystales bacterium]
MNPRLVLGWQQIALCAVFIGSSACGDAGGGVDEDGPGTSDSVGSTSSQSATAGPDSSSSSSSFSSSSGEVGGETGTSTGGIELPECLTDANPFTVGFSINGNSESDVEFWSWFLSSTTCFPGTPDVSTGEDGLVRTVLPLECPDPEARKGEPQSQLLEVTIRNQAVDLGADPVQVSYEGEPAGEDYPIPAYRFTVQRDERILVFSSSGGFAIGLDTVAGDDLCGHGFDECGYIRGVEGVSPDGETVRQFNGDPVEMVVGDHTMMVVARGVAFGTCPGDEEEKYEPAGWSEVRAVDPEVFVSR